MAATRSPPHTEEACSSLLLRTIEFMYGCLCELSEVIPPAWKISSDYSPEESLL